MDKVSYLDSWIYFVIGLVFLILINQSTTALKSKKSGFVAFAVIYLFAILRYYIGYDYDEYWKTMMGYGKERNFELLSGFIIDFATSLSFPPLGFFLFSSISIFCYKYVISNYSQCPALSWYMYFTFPAFFFQDCSTIRQAGAMGLFFLTFALIVQERYIKAFLVALMVPLFHSSGLIVYFLFLIPFLKYLISFLGKGFLFLNIVFFIFSFVIGNLVENYIMSYILNMDSYISSRFELYANSDGSGFNTMQFVFYSLNVFNFIFYSKLSSINNHNSLYILFFNLGACFYNIMQFEPKTAIRIATFFFLFELLLLPSIRLVISKLFGSLKLANICLFAIMFLLQLMIVFTYIRNYNTRVIEYPTYAPYRTWLFYM